MTKNFKYISFSAGVVVVMVFLSSSLSAPTRAAQPPMKAPAGQGSPSPLLPQTTPARLQPPPSDFLYTAETNDPAKKQGLVELGNFSWGCQGSRCVAKSTLPMPDVASCKALAEQIGQIKSYSHA